MMSERVPDGSIKRLVGKCLHVGVLAHPPLNSRGKDRPKQALWGCRCLAMGARGSNPTKETANSRFRPNLDRPVLATNSTPPAEIDRSCLTDYQNWPFVRPVRHIVATGASEATARLCGVPQNWTLPRVRTPKAATTWWTMCGNWWKAVGRSTLGVTPTRDRPREVL